MKKFLKILIILFFIGILTYIYFNFNNKKSEVVKPKSENVVDNKKVIDNKISFGKIYYISDFISNEDNKYEDKRIIYNDLGSMEIEINDDYSINVEVVDDIPPVIMLNDNLYYEIGSLENLDDKLLCADNYDKKPTCKIEGSYDLKKIGEYKLKYIVEDSSNNRDEKEFVLHITEKQETQSSNDYILYSDVIKDYKNDKTSIGIDVSKWQGEINWKKVKEAGVEFAMIRMGVQNGFDGDLFLDRYFVNNINRAKENNIEIGVYFYSYATKIEEAEEQARWVINELKNYDINLPVVFDWESFGSFNSLNLSLFDITNIQESFLKIISDNGYEASRYGSKNYLTKVWQESEYKTWLAHYISKTTYDGDYYMWQRCNNGKIAGINGFVDIDILYK